MIDEGVAFLTEPSVYRILSMFKLLGKAFKENDGAKKEYEKNLSMCIITGIQT